MRINSKDNGAKSIEETNEIDRSNFDKCLSELLLMSPSMLKKACEAVKDCPKKLKLEDLSSRELVDTCVKNNDDISSSSSYTSLNEIDITI